MNTISQRTQNYFFNEAKGRMRSLILKNLFECDNQSKVGTIHFMIVDLIKERDSKPLSDFMLF